MGTGEVWLEKIGIETVLNRARVANSIVSDDALGEIVSLFREAAENPTILANLGVDLSDAIKKLPAELKDLMHIANSNWLSSIADEAQSRLLEVLHGNEVGP